MPKSRSSGHVTITHQMLISFPSILHLNPIQAGGRGIVPPYRFFLCCAKTVSSRLMELSDF